MTFITFYHFHRLIGTALLTYVHFQVPSMRWVYRSKTPTPAGYHQSHHYPENRNEEHQETQQIRRVIVLTVVEMLAQTCQSVVGLLACGDERSERSSQVLYDIGKALNLGQGVSGDSAREKSSRDTDERSNVRGVVDTVELDYTSTVASFRGKVELTASCV